MKKEFNYTFPQTSLAIQAAGIHWKAQFYWKIIGANHKSQKAVLVDKSEPFGRFVPAFSVSEIGTMIPFGFFNEMKIHKYLQGFYKYQVDDKTWSKPFSTEVECRAHYLLWLIESGKSTLQDIKKPEEFIELSKPAPAK